MAILVLIARHLLTALGLEMYKIADTPVVQP